jgi:hypothetical protein
MVVAIPPPTCLSALDEDERSKFNLGRQGEANAISESGLNFIIPLTSTKWFPTLRMSRKCRQNTAMTAAPRNSCASVGRPSFYKEAAMLAKIILGILLALVPLIVGTMDFHDQQDEKTIQLTAEQRARVIQWQERK